MRVAIDAAIAAWTGRDPDAAAASFSADGCFMESGREPVVGTAALRARFASFFAGVADWEMSVDETLVQGERAAVFYRFRVKGASGAWSERAGCAGVLVRDGRIAVWREYAG